MLFSQMRIKSLLLYTFIFLIPFITYSQEQATVFGRVANTDNVGLAGINVYLPNTATGTTTNRNGKYELEVPANKALILVFSAIDYEKKTETIKLSPGERHQINKTLKLSYKAIEEVEIIDNSRRTESIIRVNPKLAEKVPDASGDAISALIKTLPGVSTKSELSSQYSVRGGNFDENLVYVNDIEVFRPFLVRAGQQEGMSFINSDMVSSILFSAGGFSAKYGDKMSSVLDIKYKKPVEFGGSVSLGFLGASAHLQGRSKNKKFTHISGFRYKSNQYLLNTLETQGDYKPAFSDFQTYMTYDLSNKLELSFLGNYAQNKFEFVPEDRRTDFGTVQDAVSLYMDFEGREVDRYTTITSALAAEYRPNRNLKLKFIASAYRNLEQETFDIESYYWLNQLDKQLGSETFGDSIMNLGYGRYLNHARNYLDIWVANFSHKGQFINDKNKWEWGIKYQYEMVSDDLNEWLMLDSAGYSLPAPGSDRSLEAGKVSLHETLRANHSLNSSRFTSYLQDTREFATYNAKWSFTAGVRTHYWDYNNQFVVSPRFRISLQPYWEKDMLFRFSSGIYYQPPFYKELRDSKGKLYKNLKAQRSIHFVLGNDFNFTAWNRPFKFVGEIYYKHLDNLIPYKIDNVRIQYLPDSLAKGYAMGVDLKVNGEFVKGVDSWASVSFLRTRENLYNDGHGYIPRPSDQLLNVGLFFQDYFPGNDTYKMHLTLHFGTGLPHGPPNTGRFVDTLRMRTYRRVDIGFSKVIKSTSQNINTGAGLFKPFKSIWISGEIFNLLGVKNIISYDWVTVVPNSSAPTLGLPAKYAVPNRLTARRFNLRLIIKF